MCLEHFTRVGDQRRRYMRWRASSESSRRFVYDRGREFSAWLGLVPRQTGTGGRVKLLGVSKRADKNLRALLIHSACAVLTHSKSPPEWLTEVMKRRLKNPTVVEDSTLRLATSRIATRYKNPCAIGKYVRSELPTRLGRQLSI
jgi:hypothetical protein